MKNLFVESHVQRHRCACPRTHSFGIPTVPPRAATSFSSGRCARALGRRAGQFPPPGSSNCKFTNHPRGRIAPVQYPPTEKESTKGCGLGEGHKSTVLASPGRAGGRGWSSPRRGLSLSPTARSTAASTGRPTRSRRSPCGARAQRSGGKRVPQPCRSLSCSFSALTRYLFASSRD